MTHRPFVVDQFVERTPRLPRFTAIPSDIAQLVLKAVVGRC